MSYQPIDNARLDHLLETLRPLRDRLVAHPVYAAVDSVEALRIFMQSHVFAVWDFMSLLKALQQKLTCVDLPWLPRGGSLSRRLVNEIVLAEESDDDGRGGYASHFELYLDAMTQVGADLSVIEQFGKRLADEASVLEALYQADVPDEARLFVLSTWKALASGSPVAIAAAFALGREELIPEMFVALSDRLDSTSPGQFDGFRFYLKRHIDLDGDEHGPAALRLVAALCGDDPRLWALAESSARQALEARLNLWDGVARRIEEHAQVTVGR